MILHSSRQISDRIFLERLNDFGIKLGLDRTFALLKHFGQPQEKYLSVLVAGTNGKGSVAKALSRILLTSGYRVGLYTSPHLVDIRERIFVNERPISRRLFRTGLRKVRQVVENSPFHLTPTFFEALTVMAFLAFAEEKVEVAVVEVGMGGRFDATNVVPASLSVITTVGLDHMQYLGPTQRDIAREKAGIIKEAKPVISASQKPEVLQVIRQVARDKQAKLLVHGRDFLGQMKQMNLERLQFDFSGEESFTGLETRLTGRHQVENMALAVQASLQLNKMGLSIPRKAIRVGLKKVFWPGRLQILRRKPLLLLDGAHNSSGLEVLHETLEDVYPGKKFSVLTAILKDKQWQKMLRMMLPWSKKFVFTGLKTERAISPEVLAAYILRYQPEEKVKVVTGVKEAWQMVKESKEDWVICGSLYLAGEILQQAGRNVFLGKKLPSRR